MQIYIPLQPNHWVIMEMKSKPILVPASIYCSSWLNICFPGCHRVSWEPCATCSVSGKTLLWRIENENPPKPPTANLPTQSWNYSEFSGCSSRLLKHHQEKKKKSFQLLGFKKKKKNQGRIASKFALYGKPVWHKVVKREILLTMSPVFVELVKTVSE